MNQRIIHHIPSLSLMQPGDPPAIFRPKAIREFGRNDLLFQYHRQAVRIFPQQTFSQTFIRKESLLPSPLTGR